MSIKRTIALTATAAALVLPAAATAKPVAYAGKTKTGDKVTFTLAGSKISNIKAMLPTICLPTEGNPQSGTDFFAPPGSYPLGRETRTETPAPVDSAMHYSKVSKFFHVTPAKPNRKGAITGKLHQNFSFESLGYDTWGPRLIGNVCTSDGTFTAKPLR